MIFNAIYYVASLLIRSSMDVVILGVAKNLYYGIQHKNILHQHSRYKTVNGDYI